MIDLLTLALAKKAGGGGGTSDYTELTNKPSINGVTLTGNKSAAELGIHENVFIINAYCTMNITTEQLTVSRIDGKWSDLVAAYNAGKKIVMRLNNSSSGFVYLSSNEQNRYNANGNVEFVIFNYIFPAISTGEFGKYLSLAVFAYQGSGDTITTKGESFMTWIKGKNIELVDAGGYFTGTNVEEALQEAGNAVNTALTRIGTLGNLATTDKSSLVAAVNEVNGKTGKYEIELVPRADMGGVTDIKHGNTSLTFAEFKAALESKNTEIYLNYAGNNINFYPQVISDVQIDLTSVTFSPLTNMLAAIYVTVPTNYSDSSVKFIDIENPKIQNISGASEITLENNNEYYLANIHNLAMAYPSGRFECFITLSTASSGSVSVTFPAGTQYIGAAPVFGNDETWEISIKNGIVVAVKVGDGT